MMKPADIRNLTFEAIEESLQGNRIAVWQAMHEHGPQTTRDLARMMGWDILNVRPRVTELVDLDLARLVGKHGHEGIYEALTLPQARGEWEKKQAPRAEQVLLKL